MGHNSALELIAHIERIYQYVLRARVLVLERLKVRIYLIAHIERGRRRLLLRAVINLQNALRWPKLLERGNELARPPRALALLSLRLEPEILEKLRASGPGWQTRANDLLRNALFGA